MLKPFRYFPVLKLGGNRNKLYFAPVFPYNTITFSVERNLDDHIF